MDRRAWWLLLIAGSLAVVPVCIAWVRDRRAVERDARAAREAVAMGRAAEAREPLRRWLAARPTSAEAHALMALEALADGDLAGVTRFLNEARNLGYPKDRVERVYAITLTRIGRLAEAEPILTRVRAAEAGPDPLVDDALVRIYLPTYRLAEASDVIRRWMRDVPSDARPYLWLTEVDSRVDGGDPGAQERHFREALARDPDLDAARLGLAEALARAHRNDEAEVEFRRYLARNPDDPAAMAAAGRSALERGDLDLASERLARALERAPADADALKGAAELDVRRGDLASALRRLDGALRADPIDQEALNRRAAVRARLGDRDGAEADRSALEQLRRDQAELLALRPRALAAPRDSDLAYRVAAWMFAHHLDDQGLGWARAALASHPDHGPTCRLLADYYAGRPDQAGLANYYRLKAESGAVVDVR